MSTTTGPPHHEANMQGWIEVTDPDGNVTRIKATEVVAVQPNTIHETIRCNVRFGREGQYSACTTAPADEVWAALKSALAETPD